MQSAALFATKRVVWRAPARTLLAMHSLRRYTGKGGEGRPREVWNCSRFEPDCSEPVEGREALVILNYHLPHNLEDYWGTSGLKVCADGGALQLFNRNKNLLPDAIQGDFDSVSSEVLDYYREKGVTINQHEDQDTTDLQKCLAFLERTEKETGQVNTSIIVLGGMGGCISHTFANLNTLFLYQHRKLVLVGRKNIALLLRPGLTHVHYHKLQTDEIFCSLVPLGVQSALVTTTGLKWNLSNKELAFGGLVSTSNKIESDQVTIQTNNPILWIIDFDH